MDMLYQHDNMEPRLGFSLVSFFSFISLILTHRPTYFDFSLKNHWGLHSVVSSISVIAVLMWGKAAAGTATPSSEGAPGENMSRHQAKLEAAAAAASLYGRSFVYPPANTLKRYVSEVV
jgi:hypothetical protein